MRQILCMTVYIIVLFFNGSSLVAQKFELGKVSMKELQEKVCPTDTSAVAAVLFSKAKTVFVYEKQGFYLNHIYEFRIKIYKKSGLNWANVRVPYYVGFKNLRNDIVLFSDCVSYNLVNNEIVKTKLKSEGTFDTEINEYWDEASVTMPNVQVGTVIEYKYTIKSYNFSKFPTFNFQYSIPANFAEYRTEIPEFYIYNPINTGFAKITSHSEIGFGYQNYDDEYNQGLHMSYKQINSVHKTENVPALKEENFIDNLNNYQSTIEYELEKTRFPEVPEKVFTETWEDVARSIYKDKEFGEQLNQKGHFREDLKLILKNNDSTELDKVKTIFKFVQNKMNWNQLNGYATDKGVLKAYEEGSGNVADINFILISMLNYAGINANPVLSSTIGNGIPIYPNRTVFNYVIAAADIDGKRVLLDATNKFTSIDVLPLKVLNWTGRLIRQDTSSEEINLLPSTPSKDLNNIIAVIDAKGNISGKIRKQKTEYEALRFREKYGFTAKDVYLEELEANWGEVQISDYTVENKITNLSKPIIESFNFLCNSKEEQTADKLYINPLLFFNQTKNPFNQDKRMLPIYFGYPKHTKYNISFEIPEGYTVEFVPKSIVISIPDGVALFNYKLITQDNKIQVVVSIENNGTILSATYYEDYKEFYKKAIEKQNERIILKKIIGK